MDALQQLVATCQAISVTLAAGLDRDGADDEMREQLGGLLLSRAKWEAEMEAQMLKADSTWKSASNAESRTRTMQKHIEKFADPFPEEGEEVAEAVPEGNGSRGEEEWVQPMPVAVETDPKKRALRMKFG